MFDTCDIKRSINQSIKFLHNSTVGPNCRVG